MARILVVYYSGSGNTRKAAELVARGAKELGHDVELVVADEVEMKAIKKADALALGSPDYYTYMAGQLKVFFDRALDIRDELAGKPCVCFLSHGGGGGGIKSVERLASAIKLKKVAESVVVRGSPEGDDQKKCVELGRSLARALTE